MVLWEDEALIVCRKPAGVISEGSGMPELLKEQTGAKEIFCVHRLERETAGLMVYAKTKRAAAALSAAIEAGKLEKRYLAVVQGAPPAEGEMQDLLFRDKAKNKSYVVTRMRKGVREARLRYETLQQIEGFSLVRVELLTGRSHQIRVQFASRGFPLLGDSRYGGSHRELPLALYSAALRFPHPLSGEILSFSSAPPEEAPWTWFSLSL